MRVIDDRIFEEIKKFVEDQGRGYGTSLTRETKIETELGVAGDDSVEFIIDYGKHFNVDVTNFMCGDYFSDEGGYLLIRAILSSFFKNYKYETGKKQLTLGDLEKGVIAGKLDEEVING